MPPVTKPKPAARPAAPAVRAIDLAALGVQVALADAADNYGLTVADVAADPAKLADAGLAAAPSPAQIRDANRLHRNRYDGELWRTNRWLQDRVEEICRANGRIPPAESAPPPPSFGSSGAARPAAKPAPAAVPPAVKTALAPKPKATF